MFFSHKCKRPDKLSDDLFLTGQNPFSTRRCPLTGRSFKSWLFYLSLNKPSPCLKRPFCNFDAFLCSSRPDICREITKFQWGQVEDASIRKQYLFLSKRQYCSSTVSTPKRLGIIAKWLQLAVWKSRHHCHICMMVNENNRSLISLFCSSTGNCTFHYCYRWLKRLDAATNNGDGVLARTRK